MYVFSDDTNTCACIDGSGVYIGRERETKEPSVGEDAQRPQEITKGCTEEYGDGGKEREGLREKRNRKERRIDLCKFLFL